MKWWWGTMGRAETAPRAGQMEPNYCSMLCIATEYYKIANLPLANRAPKAAALLVIDIEFNMIDSIEQVA